MRIKDKVAIITGGARGIGKETALLFAREGAMVVICDFDAAAGEQTLAELKSTGARALFFKVDVTDRASVQNMVDATKGEFGRIDILINNAGITADAFLTKMTEEQWDKVIAVNLKGVFNCTQAVVPIMMEQGSGVILNASSVVGVYGNVGQTNYAATKAGVIGITKSWAKELGKKGIRVNAIAPGFIITDMTAKVPEKVLELMQSRTPLGRLGVPRDVAAAYLFLASDEASYINGQVLGVDGGLMI
ncbi:3-oxoacyl-(acyl-carrier-protein) reductase [Moorella glycerini]|uniref:3-oxoacyl-[acyl-carrier-protein] reductase n=1 Tax=Neomoorella stamsii TaxID=1266720 RepID=A0A9X7P5D1_9FIRM|nr:MULTISPECIES: 3-oxoacyl-ACP reductase FabG [Moorella]PRR71290.1 3-oxoacyl-[acyl-carrier-protein] reductase FabG [Moorella stamsii]CEP66669.1 3-oxoacyl-(acyl-carrier-protein) reductase [Moorella glycerini]